MNYSVCFSAKPDYFAETKSLAEPAVQFYTKVYLEPFALDETIEYTRSVFATSPDTTAIIAAWLHEKTLGHPYFLAFVCKHLSATQKQIQPRQLEAIWPAIFDQLGRERVQPAVLFTERQAATSVEHPAAQAAPNLGQTRSAQVRRACIPAFSQHVPADLHDDTSGTHQVLDGPRWRGNVRPLRQNQRGRGVPQRSGRESGSGFRHSFQNSCYWTEWTEMDRNARCAIGCECVIIRQDNGRGVAQPG